jgi:hypothetical protein
MHARWWEIQQQPVLYYSTAIAHVFTVILVSNYCANTVVCEYRGPRPFYSFSCYIYTLFLSCCRRRLRKNDREPVVVSCTYYVPYIYIYIHHMYTRHAHPVICRHKRTTLYACDAMIICYNVTVAVLSGFRALHIFTCPSRRVRWPVNVYTEKQPQLCKIDDTIHSIVLRWRWWHGICDLITHTCLLLLSYTVQGRSIDENDTFLPSIGYNLWKLYVASWWWL